MSVIRCAKCELTMDLDTADVEDVLLEDDMTTVCIDCYHGLVGEDDER